jgi:hypothetical protein
LCQMVLVYTGAIRRRDGALAIRLETPGGHPALRRTPIW